MSMSAGRPIARCLARSCGIRPAPEGRCRAPLQQTQRLSHWKGCSTYHPQRIPEPSRALLRPSTTSREWARTRNFRSSRRAFSESSALAHGHLTPPKPGEELHVTFIDKEGDEHKYEVAKGDNLLDIAQANDLEMEGACGGSCACSTCHVIVEGQEMYDSIPEPDDDENDMLDLAFGLTETSRLGCQVKMVPEINGVRVKLPSMTRNLQQSDFSKS